MAHVMSTHLVMARGTQRDGIVAAKYQVYEILRDQDFEQVSIEGELEAETCSLKPDRSLSTFVRGFQVTA